MLTNNHHVISNTFDIMKQVFWLWRYTQLLVIFTEGKKNINTEASWIVCVTNTFQFGVLCKADQSFWFMISMELVRYFIFSGYGMQSLPFLNNIAYDLPTAIGELWFSSHSKRISKTLFMCPHNHPMAFPVLINSKSSA